MAAETNFVQSAITKFDGHYDNWSMLMETSLKGILVFGGDRNPCRSMSEDYRSTTKYNGRSKAERLEGQELFVLSH